VQLKAVAKAQQAQGTKAASLVPPPPRKQPYLCMQADKQHLVQELSIPFRDLRWADRYHFSPSATTELGDPSLLQQ
jgi:hypothetical protein